ncbi:hypothetical protein CP533_4802 [Ophiocordyceps camponoti-saundersi (nom. inval.)]|nr:hypothetical protein CP533_4802 [Ophiocordyceps camponoti-saundersi (nom. inval.)]
MSFLSFDFDQHLAALRTPEAEAGEAEAGARAGGRGSWSRASRIANCCSPGSHSPFSSPPLALPDRPASWRPSYGFDLQNPWQTTSRLDAEAGSSFQHPQPFSPILGDRHVAPHSLEDFDEAELSMAAATNAARMGLLKDELSVIAGKITPGVDDTPYIQYALEALTREPESHPEVNASKGGWINARQPSQHVPLGAERILAPVTRPEPVRSLRQGTSYGEPAHVAVPEQARSPLAPGAHLQHWIAVDRNTLQIIDPRGTTYPPLTFKPRILRPLSTAALMILCLLMMTAYIFSNRYAQHNLGLTPYPGSIYSGQYFVFRILPPLVAVVILIYSQCILTTSLRILPFTNMAQEDPRERYLALFRRLYPRTFLLPQLMGPWQLIVFDLATWLAILTVPLQSSAFTCIYVRDEWIWAPSQGVAWVLVGLYALLGASTAIVTVFWLRQWTGLKRDVRSIADVVTLVSHTNTMHSYARQTVLEPGSDFKAELRDRWFDRLGYWQTGDVMAGGIWHAIGTTAMAPGQGDADHARRESCDVSIASRDLALWGGRYLPLSLRDWPLVGFAMVTGGLLVALLIVCFLPQTRLDAGFMPLISAGPNQSAFSAANFVYSFVPALLGMVLFLLFLSVDLSLRMMQPWGSMAGAEGATARRSILADYPACLPLQSAWRALGNGHWRAAVTSMMAVLSAAIPVLAGGLFMALTSADGQVRMFPSMPVLGVLLALLLLYVGNLCLLVPRRRQFVLPHAVESVAAIISLCSAEDVVGEAALRMASSRGDLAARLGVRRGSEGEESVWFFGLSPGKDEQRPSVRRWRRFTEMGGRAHRLSKA